MRYAILLAVLAMLVPACDSGSTDDPSTNPPEKTTSPDPEPTPDPADVDPGPEVATETVVLEVSGMTWGISCVTAVSGMLEVVPGVRDVSVDFAEKTATVTVAKGTPVATLASGVSGKFSAKVQE